MFKNLRKKKKGFTLIELIIVIAIIAILSAIAIPKFSDVRTGAKEKTDIANAKTIANAANTLIAEDRLSSGTYTIGDKDNADNDLIEGYLQNVPTPKSEGTNFIVTVAEGKVTVKSNLATNPKTFFPAP